MVPLNYLKSHLSLNIFLQIYFSFYHLSELDQFSISSLSLPTKNTNSKTSKLCFLHYFIPSVFIFSDVSWFTRIFRKSECVCTCIHTTQDNSRCSEIFPPGVSSMYSILAPPFTQFLAFSPLSKAPKEYIKKTPPTCPPQTTLKPL